MKRKCRDQAAGDGRNFDCADMMREMMEKFCRSKQEDEHSVISSMMTKCHETAARFCDQRSEKERSST
jgi:hypothetical protein